MTGFPLRGKIRNTISPHPDDFSTEMVAEIDLAWADARRLLAARAPKSQASKDHHVNAEAAALSEFIFRGLAGGETAFEKCKSKRVAQIGVSTFSNAMSVMRDARLFNTMMIANMAEACSMGSFDEALSALNEFAPKSVSPDVDLSGLMATMLEAACVEEPGEIAAVLGKRWAALASAPAWRFVDWSSLPGNRIDSTWGSGLGALGLLLCRHPSVAAEGGALLAVWQGWSCLGMGEICRLGEVLGGTVCSPEAQWGPVSETFWSFMPWPAKIGACAVAVAGSPQEEWMWRSIMDEISAASGTLREEMGAALSVVVWGLLDAPRLDRLDAAFSGESSRWMREYAANLSLNKCGTGFADALTASLKDERSEWARSLWTLSGDIPENQEMSELLFNENDSPWPRMFEVLLAHREGLVIASSSESLGNFPSAGKGLRI